MKKVVCARCGLVNLESFPSFPLCEGCGTRLPQSKGRPWIDWIQRPVQTFVWAVCISASVSVLALLSIGIARETRLRDRGPLVVTSSLKSDSSTSHNIIVSLLIAAADDTDREPIRHLRLRINDSDAKRTGLTIISPTQSGTQMLGIGRYFLWDRFTPQQTLTLRLRPEGQINMELVADGFQSFHISLSPVPNAKNVAPLVPIAPLDLSSNRSN